MTEKERILKEITNYYLHGSLDFNGLPSYQMGGYDKESLIELVREGNVQILTENECSNPHICGFEIQISIETQVDYITNSQRWFVAYPTARYLRSLQIFDERPFTVMLENGAPKLKFFYFNPIILLKYFNDPRYRIWDRGYRGYIELTSDCDTDEESNYSYITNYALAYKRDAKKKERYIGIPLCDLAKLNDDEQYLLRGHLLREQDKYAVCNDYYREEIEAEWVDGIWIFRALLEEIQIINQMCGNMGLPDLFLHPLSPNGQWYSSPKYRNMLLPTLDEYYSFVIELEKIVVQNINVRVFQKTDVGFTAIPPKPGETNPKTLQIFEEWLEKNWNFSCEKFWRRDIIQPLKKLRKIRQTPAHEKYLNKYDPELFTKQDELIIEIYSAVRIIRLLFANHPSNQGIRIPEDLITGENIRIY